MLKIKGMIRPLARQDLEAIFEICQQAIIHPWSKQALLESLDRADMLNYGLFSPSLLGFIMLCKLENEGEIYLVAVSPACQGQGYGGQLLDHLLQEGKVQGVTRFFLEVSVDNASAINLYNSRAFKQVGLRKNYYRASQNRSIDALIMKKEII